MYITETFVEHNITNHLLNEGVMDVIKSAVSKVDKQKAIKYAVIAYLSALGVSDFNQGLLNSEAEKLSNVQSISVLDIKKIGNIVGKVGRFVKAGYDKNRELDKQSKLARTNIKSEPESKTVKSNNKTVKPESKTVKSKTVKSKTAKPESKTVKSKTDNPQRDKKYYFMDFNLDEPIKMSKKSLEKIKSFETLSLVGYKAKVNDKGGKVSREDHITIGYGHVCPKQTYKLGQKISKEKANELFMCDIREKVGVPLRLRLKEMRAAGIDVNKIPQNVIDAMGDLHFNAGQGNFSDSEFFALMKKGKFEEAGIRLKTTCITHKGVIQPGLVERAQERSDIFFKHFNHKTNMWEKS